MDPCDPVLGRDQTSIFLEAHIHTLHRECPWGKKVSLTWKFLPALVETSIVKPLLFHFSVSLGWKAYWQHSRMTEALREL